MHITPKSKSNKHSDSVTGDEFKHFRMPTKHTTQKLTLPQHIYQHLHGGHSTINTTWFLDDFQLEKIKVKLILMINYKNTEKVKKRAGKKHEYLKTHGATKLSKWQYKRKKKHKKKPVYAIKKLFFKIALNSHNGRIW